MSAPESDLLTGVPPVRGLASNLSDFAFSLLAESAPSCPVPPRPAGLLSPLGQPAASWVDELVTETERRPYLREGLLESDRAVQRARRERLRKGCSFCSGRGVRDEDGERVECSRCCEEALDRAIYGSER